MFVFVSLAHTNHNLLKYNIHLRYEGLSKSFFIKLCNLHVILNCEYLRLTIVIAGVNFQSLQNFVTFVPVEV